MWCHVFRNLGSTVLCLLSLGSTVALAQDARERQADVQQIEIIPASRMRNSGRPASSSQPSRVNPGGRSDNERSAHPMASVSSAGFTREEYHRVFRGIPFSRTQYRINPGYRHDSTMEILTGNPRTQTIVQPRAPVTSARIPQPARPARQLPPHIYGIWPGAFPWLTIW